jgi:N-acetylmuramoyl-L-alanine amidase
VPLCGIKEVIMKINIDAGHGASTAGKRTPPMPVAIDVNGDGKINIKKGEQYHEHYANVGVANLLMQELERCGIDTMQTGFKDDNAADDQDTALATRQKDIVAAKCDYSISIHFNAYGDGTRFNSTEGVGIYIHDKYIGHSEKLAQTVLKHLVGGTKQKSRGVSKQSLAMVNCNNLNTKAAILCELAFMTNQREAVELMASKVFWKECAKEICKGLCEYTGIKYLEEVYIPTSTMTPTSPKEDIKWAQGQLNKVLPVISGITPLKVDGNYGPVTRIAILIYWKNLGWGKDMADNGARIGKSTIKALAAGRKE